MVSRYRKNEHHKNPFVVHLLEKEETDFQKACACCSNTAKLNIATVRWLQISKENPVKVKTKTNLMRI